MRNLARRIVVPAVLLAGLLSLWSGCRGGTGGKQSQPTIRIGSLLMLSGQYKSAGELEKRGIAVAEREIKESGGPPLELLIYDHQFDKTVCKEKVEMLYSRGVRYVADIMGSGLCLDAAPRFNNRKMIVLSGSNTSTGLSKEGGKYFFRVIPSDGVAARQIVEWAVEIKKMTACVVYGKTDWGEQLQQVFTENFTAQGGQVVMQEAVSDDQIIFGPLVAKMKAYPEALLFLAVAPNQAGMIAKEARKQGLKNYIFGTDNFTGEEIITTGGVALNGVRYVIPSVKTASVSPQRQRFDKLYHEMYGPDEPHIFAVNIYDVVHILYQVAQRAGDDTEKAVVILEKLKYQGASGPIAFDSSHDIVVPRYGRYQFVVTQGKVQRAETSS